MLAPLDLKLVGLIVSAGAAVSVRFLSDFSFATIQHQATLANLSLDRLSLGSFGELLLIMLRYQLQRDWFNLSPQAPPEAIGLMIALVAAYALLRRGLAPSAAAATVLLAAMFVPLVATAGACTWVLLRAARVA